MSEHEQAWVPVGMRPVSSGGKVTIPKDPYRHDYVWLQPGATVRVRVRVGNGEVLFEDRVLAEGRVRIPKGIRDEYGIDDGDTVAISVRRPPVGGSE